MMYPATVDDAVEAIECAVALGMDVQSPVGVTVYTGRYYLDQETTRHVGVYVDEESVKHALVGEITDWWRQSGYRPWSDSFHYDDSMTETEWNTLMRMFVQENGEEGILTRYREGGVRYGTGYDIVEVKVGRLPSV